MKAIVCHRFGSFRDLAVEDRPPPEAGPDEVLVELRAWGVNYVDVIMVGGTYQLRPDLPFVPGTEAAGVVSAIGANVTGFAIGGVSPLGHLTPVATWMDESLLGFETVWAAAGAPNAVFEVTGDALQKATSATVSALS